MSVRKREKIQKVLSTQKHLGAFPANFLATRKDFLTTLSKSAEEGKK